MKNKKSWLLGIILVIILITFIISTYTIDETEQVIITQFGRPVGDPVTEPGIHIKLPFIQVANYFEKRFLEWDGKRNQVPTKDKRFIWVDTYARWQISDPLLFFQRLRDERGAQSRLDALIDGEVRNSVANHLLVELVRTTNREFQKSDEFIEEDKTVFKIIKYGREVIRQEILDAVKIRTSDFGIEILDFRFKRIDYIEEDRKKVYERMITERERIADKFRSEGQGEASRILGEKERELKRITSEAYRTSQEIIGKADAKAIRIYAKAYNQSSLSQNFYKFLKTMETYENTMDENTWIFLSTDGDFYKYLQKQR